MNRFYQYDHYKNTITQGHRYRKLEVPYKAKAGSHDDGAATGLFLGGIGCPACSRDLTGKFARWHFESGTHVRQEIEEVFLSLSWCRGDASGYFRLDERGAEEAGVSREVYSLFPVTRESYDGEALPFSVAVEFFSPLVPGDDQASTLPVWYATVIVRNTGDIPVDIGTALFMPNFLGWRNQRMTPLDRPSKPWPSQTHAGNTARPFQGGRTCGDGGRVSGVIQERFPERSIRRGMNGEIALVSHGSSRQNSSREICYKSGQNCIDRPPEEQRYTIGWVENHFAREGRLPETGKTWRAHWDEAVGSAVCRSGGIEPGETEIFEFCMAYDLPLVEFGSDRLWYRKYTEAFGREGRHSSEIACFAVGQKDEYRERVDQWQNGCLEKNDHLPLDVRASMINELYFINGGGSVWVSGWADQRESGIPAPRLGDGEHAALLEGFDIGYYYYNTSDLWPYAWYAVSRWWPAFSELVFRDFLQSIPLEVKTGQMIYRTENMAPILTAGKLPHDLGSPMSDPWHEINGYQMRDDSNLWKDLNAGFIVSYYLHKRFLGLPVNDEEWALLREADRFVMEQVDACEGLPVHDEFGDSTWDNLGIRGRASYSGSLTIACGAVMSELARERGEVALEKEWLARLEKGQESFIKHLWNGEFFRLSDAGRYAGCIMPDGILGFFLADLAGLGGVLSGIGRESLVSHLKAVYRYNFKNYVNGTQGPLLVAERERTDFPGDGGDELQVNEVLVGSAWMTAAMMHHYGLTEEGNEIVSAVRHILHKAGGLQFRTPAAYSSRGVFRAPMNMRPLAIWFLDSGYLCEKCLKADE